MKTFQFVGLCACADDFGQEFIVLFKHPETNLLLSARIHYDGNLLYQLDESENASNVYSLSRTEKYSAYDWRIGVANKTYIEMLTDAGFGEWLVPSSMVDLQSPIEKDKDPLIFT